MKAILVSLNEGMQIGNRWGVLRHELPGILSLPSSPAYVLGLVDGKLVSGRTVPHDSLNSQNPSSDCQFTVTMEKEIPSSKGPN